MPSPFNTRPATVNPDVAVSAATVTVVISVVATHALAAVSTALSIAIVAAASMVISVKRTDSTTTTGTSNRPGFHAAFVLGNESGSRSARASSDIQAFVASMKGRSNLNSDKYGARRLDPLRTLLRKLAVLTVAGCDGARLTVPTLSPMTGRHTHEVEHLMMSSHNHGIERSPKSA